MSDQANATDVLGLHYANDDKGVTITLFEGPKGTGKRSGAVWSEKTREIETVRFELSDFPEVLQDDGEGEGAGPKSFAGYGLLKLLADRTSQESGNPEGKLEAMRRYAEIFKSGKWRERKESSGRKAKVDTVFVRAVMQVQGFKANQLGKVTAKLEATDAATLKKIRGLPAVQEAMKKIREEESGEDIELDFDLPADE